MILLALLGMWSADQAPQRKPKVVEAVVVLEERPITLPPLPHDVGQGRQQFKEVHAQIQTALRDLGLSLQSLYAKPEAGITLARDLNVPAAFAIEGSELVEVMTDLEHGRLESAFTDVWKGWQAALVEGGLAKPVRVSAGRPEAHSKRFEDAKKKGKETIKVLSRLPPKRTGRLDASFNEENADLFPDLTTYRAPDSTFNMTGNEYATLQNGERSANIAQRSQAVADKLIPSLSETWDPLVTHLNGRALRLADLEQVAAPSLDATVRTLRVQTKIAFLERFRTALWYCDLVWCQAASVEAPAPPQRMGKTARR